MNNFQDTDDENPFLNSETIKLLQDLLQSVDGRKIAKALLRKFKVLSQSYSELGENERKIVHEILNKDFRDQLKALHANLLWGETSQSISGSGNWYFDQFWIFLSFCTVILSISMKLDLIWKFKCT